MNTQYPNLLLWRSCNSFNKPRANYDTVPGASVLIRIQKASSKSESIPLPDYRSHQYLTNYYNAPDKDRELMSERLLEKSFTIKEWIDHWKALEKVKPTEDTIGWVDQRMKANENTPLFEYKFFDKYNINEGFEIYIEGVHNAPLGMPLITICSFNPPGNYYDTPRNTENVFCFDKVNFNSPLNSMQYVDELKIIRGIDPNETWQIILDIKGIKNENGVTRVIDCGWSVISLFDRSHNGIYVNSGVYMVWC